MAQFRLITTEPHYVAHPVNRVVEVDEVFDVADDLAPMFEAAPTRFEPVSAKATTTKKKDD